MPKVPALPNLDVPGSPKKGAAEPGAGKGYGVGVRDLDTSHMLAMGGGQLFDPTKEKKDPAAAKGTGQPLTITAVGDRLIITGDDPKQVALAHELARLIISGKGEVYKVFRLNNSNATEVARVLNEWFNGPQQQQNQQNRNRSRPSCRAAAGLRRARRRAVRPARHDDHAGEAAGADRGRADQ